MKLLELCVKKTTMLVVVVAGSLFTWIGVVVAVKFLYWAAWKL